MAHFNLVNKFYCICQKKLYEPWKWAGEMIKVSMK